jgi:hypothetical protein
MGRKHIARRAPFLCLLLAGCLLGLLLDSEDGSTNFPQNISKLLPDYRGAHSTIFIFTTVRTSNPKVLISDLKRSSRIK